MRLAPGWPPAGTRNLLAYWENITGKRLETKLGKVAGVHVPVGGQN